MGATPGDIGRLRRVLEGSLERACYKALRRFLGRSPAMRIWTKIESPIASVQ